MHIVHFFAMQIISVSKHVTKNNAIMLSAAILGVLVLNEHMTLMEWGGCAVIFASTVVAQVQWNPPKKGNN